MRFKSMVYKGLRYSNTVSAVQKGTVPKRAGRVAYGKVTGRIAGWLFR
jgi:hypothetical protein